jgi:pyrroline-5-carboxylate reductase
MMNQDKIAIIGGGKLGSAIARGFVKGGVPQEQLIITQRNAKKRSSLQKEGFRVVTELDAYSDICAIMVVVKPKDAISVLKEIKIKCPVDVILMSVVSGMRRSAIRAIVGAEYPIFRLKFSVLAEMGPAIIPLSLGNAQAEQSLLRVEELLKPLGTTAVVSEATMDMSGWDLSTLPAVIIPQLIKERLEHVPAQDKILVEKLILSGLQRTLSYLIEEQKKGQPLSESVTQLVQRIATPGGLNDAALAYLSEQRFWHLSSCARAVYEKRLDNTADKISARIESACD